ncbi:hypothetical protein CC78DRAFT_153463 [Lojkania enalia]|uniref:Uncharacterized protein n=1 Tax=Lojkania enalia TaxID=147567 RepID=A0A9P4KEN3_9PLEO|nr:hypothetical protein CC78DRAFT_153463 [Didymosphaeria enalia]
MTGWLHDPQLPFKPPWKLNDSLLSLQTIIESPAAASLTSTHLPLLAPGSSYIILESASTESRLPSLKLNAHLHILDTHKGHRRGCAHAGSCCGPRAAAYQGPGSKFVASHVHSAWRFIRAAYISELLLHSCTKHNAFHLLSQILGWSHDKSTTTPDSLISKFPDPKVYMLLC